MQLFLDNNELKIAHEIYKATLAYSLSKYEPNPDGSFTHVHSDEFLDKHPERKDNPEYTEEEEKAEMQYVYDVARFLAVKKK